MSSVSRFRAAWLVDLGLGAVLAVALGEVAIRVVGPMPRTQVVRQMPGIELTTLGGLPAWDIAIGPDLANADCLARGPERTVAFVGDSIFVTTPGNTAAEVFTERLQARWDDEGRAWCAVNVSRPGFTGPLKAAAALAEVAPLGVDLVVYGIWNEDGDPWRLDDAIYELASYARDARGYPRIPWLPAPAGVHRALFRHSALWRYAVLALGHARPAPEVVRRRQQAPVDAVIDMAAASGAEVWAVQLPRLDVPFATSAATPQTTRAAVRAHAATRGAVPWVLAADLVAYDVEALRLDSCCHYNDAGHEALARIFHDRLLAAWSGDGEALIPVVDGPEGDAP